MQNGISLYLGSHLLASPAQGIRSMLHRFVRAELFDKSDFDNMYKTLDELYDYKLTY